MVEQLKLEQFYTRRCIDLITPEVGMQILMRIVGQGPAQLTAISANWALAREMAPQGVLPPMFLLLGEQAGEVAANDATSDDELLQQLSTTEASKRLSLLEEHLQEMIARVLQLDASQFSGQEALTSLGMDSMMAIEVKNRIGSSAKVDISVLELLQGITVAQLAERILSSLQLDKDETVSLVEATAPIEELQQLVEQADGEELERLLAELEQTSSTGASIL